MQHSAQFDRRALLACSLVIGLPTWLGGGRAQAQGSGQPAASPEQLLAEQKLMLAQANRILEHEGVLSGPGHVSCRHPTRPDRYLMSRTLPPQLTVPSDILEFDLDSQPIAPLGDTRVYTERYIHGQFYKHRSDVNAVVHSHAADVLPFTVTDQPLIPVIVDATVLGTHVPLWDIRDRFGDGTDVMVTDNDRAADLVRVAGDAAVVLIRGHGYVAVAPSIMSVTHLAIKTQLNALVEQRALALGKIKEFTPAEMATQAKVTQDQRVVRRFWLEWLARINTQGL
jgi:HCOMODA/2-hydroxy-3-carboxy-muconic semialdehyde decarboxylase